MTPTNAQRQARYRERGKDARKQVAELKAGNMMVLEVRFGDLVFAVKRPIESVALKPGVSTKLRELAGALAEFVEDRADPMPEGCGAEMDAWLERRGLLRKSRKNEALTA